jgi:ferredoxin-NADP reductase
LDGLTPAVQRAPGRWQLATVTSIREETPTVKSYRLELETWMPHLPGQHYDVRLTAPDGYRASRSYSVASPPDGSNELDLTVERLDDGEVSSFLHDVARRGDEFEVRGPIGGWFVWDGSSPALLVGGGSGVVPLMSMLRYARHTGRTALLRLVVSVRTATDLYYADELPGPETSVIYTRVPPAGVTRPPGRLRTEDLADGLPDDLAASLTTFVCGSNGFADHVTSLLIGRGVEATSIRVERFGETG